MDSIPELVRVSKEEQECADHFKQNSFRDNSGRFLVKLQHKVSPSLLVYTKELTMQHSLEHRLSKWQSIYENYREFVKENSDLGSYGAYIRIGKDSLICFLLTSSCGNF